MAQNSAATTDASTEDVTPNQIAGAALSPTRKNEQITAEYEVAIPDEYSDASLSAKRRAAKQIAQRTFADEFGTVGASTVTGFGTECLAEQTDTFEAGCFRVVINAH
jgi:hypothetical protein